MSSEVMTPTSRNGDALPAWMTVLADGLLVFDTAGVTGHPDHDIDLKVIVDRTRQRLASHAHTSQALPTSVLWRRLELLGDTESLRWLRPNLGATVTP